MIFMLCSIYISIALMPCFLHEHPWRGWSCQKNLHPFLYKCSLLAWSSPTLLVAPFSHMYFYILSFHFLSGILLLLDFLHKLLTLPSPNMSKPSQSVSVHPFHHSTSLRLHEFPHHILHTCFYYFHHPTCHSTCPSQATHFHNTHSWLLSPIHVYVFDSHIKVGKSLSLPSCTQSSLT